MTRYLFLLLVLSGIAASAQKIRFTDTTNKWLLVEVGGDPGQVVSYSRSAAFQADTVISGNNYYRISYPGVFHTQLAIREDSVAGKLYFRFVSPRYRAASSTDTLEHVFFDYNLRVADTFVMAYGSFRWAHVVQAMDSVNFGGQDCRIWKMRRVSGTSTLLPIVDYQFVESVGTLHGPLFSVCPVVFESGMQLRCFTSKELQPVCSPPLTLPFAGMPVWMGIRTAVYFDNDSSCNLEPALLSLAKPIHPTQAMVLPNPGGRESVLMLPPFIDKVTLTITDVTGRIIASVPLGHLAAFPIGQYLSTPGVYYYILQDAATGQRFTGRFIFR